MAIDFPTGPAVNDLYTYNSVTYKWDGVFWSPQLIGAISSFLIDDTINTAVTNFTFTHTTSLTPGIGIGTGISLGAETSSGNVEIGAIIEAVATGVTAPSENFDLRFKNMTAGAAATEKMRIDSVGRVSISAAPVLTWGGGFPDLGISSAAALMALQRFSTGDTEPYLVFAKSKSATIGGHTVVANGTGLGGLVFVGSDGTDFAWGAEIGAYVDGTPGNNDMPTRLAFFTSPDGSETPVERMRLDSAGHVSVGYAGWIGQGRFEVSDPGGLYGFSVIGYNNSAGSISLHNTRNASPAGHTITQSGDYHGFIDFSGSDGANWIPGAEIAAVVDSTPGVGDMPTRLEFATTPDGSGGPVVRMQISNYGTVSVNFAGATPLPGEPSRVVIAQPGSDWGLAMCGLDGGGFYGLITATGGATPTSHTVIGASGPIGSFTFMGSDGSVYRRAAQISVNAEGTPSSNNMPAAIYFGTGPGAGSAIINRLRITAAGHIIATSATTAAPTLATNGDWVMTPTSNTQMRISYRGSDGTTRVGNITLV